MKTLIQIRYLLIIVFFLPGAADWTSAQAVDDPDWKPFLSNLTGSWELSGGMGDQILRQHCEGGWILQEQFFQLDCTAIPPDSSGYQAKYLIGYHSEKEHYIFHLFDVYGGNYSESLGTGKLEDNRITFEFRYDSGPFQNIFVWNGDSRIWTMILRQKNEEGKWEPFSEKTLRRM